MLGEEPGDAGVPEDIQMSEGDAKNLRRLQRAGKAHNLLKAEDSLSGVMIHKTDIIPEDSLSYS